VEAEGEQGDEVPREIEGAQDWASTLFSFDSAGVPIPTHAGLLCSLGPSGPSQESYMRTVTDSFSHVLLFACPQCGRPLASACASTKKNLEVADAQWFNPHCHCGWTGPVIGVQALKHWVEPWKTPVAIGPDAPDSCDGEPLTK
jgi:hypothetical protein